MRYRSCSFTTIGNTSIIDAETGSVTSMGHQNKFQVFLIATPKMIFPVLFSFKSFKLSTVESEYFYSIEKCTLVTYIFLVSYFHGMLEYP